MSRRIQSQLLVLKYEGTPRDAYTLIIRTDQSLTDLTLFRDAFSLAFISFHITPSKFLNKSRCVV